MPGMREGRRGPRKGFPRLGLEIVTEARSVQNAPKRLRSGPESAVWSMPTDRGKRKYKRLFLAADLHGSEVVFRKFLAAATFYEADALLIGGDITAKSITPIVQQNNGRFQTRLAGAVRDDLSEAELAPIEKAIADSGPYPVRMAAASSKSMLAGFGARGPFSSKQVYSAHVLTPAPKTWSPGLNRFTCLPTASISPASSDPGMGLFGLVRPAKNLTMNGSAFRRRTSPDVTVVANTLIKT